MGDEKHTPTVDKLMQEDNCPKPHNFQPNKFGSGYFGPWTCSLCGTIWNFEKAHSYMEGVKHGIEKTKAEVNDIIDRYFRSKRKHTSKVSKRKGS